MLVASTGYSGPRRVHLPGRGWTACEFSKNITSVLSGSIGRLARWSESQRSRRRGWRLRGGFDEGRGSGELVASARLFHGHRLPIQYRRRALYVFLALLSPVRVYKPIRDLLLPILIEIDFSPLSSCPAPSSSELAGTRLYSPAFSR